MRWPCYEARCDLFALAIIAASAFTVIKDCKNETIPAPAQTHLSAPLHGDGERVSNLSAHGERAPGWQKASPCTQAELE